LIGSPGSGKTMLTSSCVPTVIGAYAYKSSKTKQARADFMEDFNRNNTEGEKAGLEPLDLCEEKYNFDEGWAMDDNACPYPCSRKIPLVSSFIKINQIQVSFREPEFFKNLVECGGMFTLTL